MRTDFRAQTCRLSLARDFARHEPRHPVARSRARENIVAIPAGPRIRFRKAFEGGWLIFHPRRTVSRSIIRAASSPRPKMRLCRFPTGNLDAEFSKKEGGGMRSTSTSWPASVPVERAKLAGPPHGRHGPKSRYAAAGRWDLSPGADVDLYIVLVKLRTKTGRRAVAGLTMWDASGAGADFRRCAGSNTQVAPGGSQDRKDRLSPPRRRPVRNIRPNWPMRVTMKTKHAQTQGAGVFARNRLQTLRTLYSGIMTDSIAENALAHGPDGKEDRGWRGRPSRMPQRRGAPQTEPSPGDAGQPPK